MCQMVDLLDVVSMDLEMFQNIKVTTVKKYFFRVYIASSKQEEGWEDSRQLCKPSTTSRVCITFENSPGPRVFR